MTQRSSENDGVTRAAVVEARQTSHEAECARRYMEQSAAILRLDDRMNRLQWLIITSMLGVLGTLATTVTQIVINQYR